MLKFTLNFLKSIVLLCVIQLQLSLQDQVPKYYISLKGKGHLFSSLIFFASPVPGKCQLCSVQLSGIIPEVICDPSNTKYWYVCTRLPLPFKRPEIDCNSRSFKIFNLVCVYVDIPWGDDPGRKRPHSWLAELFHGLQNPTSRTTCSCYIVHPKQWREQWRDIDEFGTSRAVL